MSEDERVYVIGEDLEDPYGGAFGVTRGLSTEFPGRVVATPISEAAIIGVSIGMAVRGFRPVVEIMFGDFITLCADQLVNVASKLSEMSAGLLSVPIVVRTPMGGGRGYGPTHSQTLDKLYLGVPGLRVVAPSVYHDSGGLLKNAVRDDHPVLFSENKLLYPAEQITLDDGLVESLKFDYEKAPLNEQDRAMLDFAIQLTRDATQITKKDHERLHHVGFDDQGILQITLIASWFNYINRVADGLGVGRE